MKIQVAVEDGTAFTSLGGNLHLPERFEVTAEGPELPYRVTLQATLQEGRFVCDQLTVTRVQGGAPVTSEGIRELPVGELVRRGADALLMRMGTAGGQLEHANAGGPTPEMLEAVAGVYRLAYATGASPTRTVMSQLGLPRSTAGRWVAMARKRGLLGPATPRKAGG